MNVLIVDDNKNNRMILSLLLEDYMDEHSEISFEMDEAVDGLDAVRKCDEKSYDIVLMDIMMPNMDGIEATKLIRQNHKKLMIIAVSAVDDTQRQKEILSNGAEDYISKPVNSDIFNTRVANYVSLLKSRTEGSEHPISNDKKINLFTKEVYQRYMHFSLSNEDALSELWEYYLLDGEENFEGLSDVVRTIFSVGEVQIRLNIESSLFAEESEGYKFFTITNIDDVPSKIIELLIKKNEVSCEYKIVGDKLSFKLRRVEVTESFKEMPIVSKTPVTETPVIQEENIASTVEYISAELEVYNYIEDDDMVDLEEYAGRLSSLMLIVGSGDVSEDEAIEIYTYIEKLGSILSTYSEVYIIAKSLSELAADMSTHIAEFIQNSEALGPMCAAFSKDLTNWIEKSFHTGAPSVDFMNDTIAVNCQTIGSMLKMDEAPAEGDDFDDIFDF
ncbi:MAG: response regulator [Campylobacterota bacterium]|nr:response regulator [Campylobacterota bacterium]